MKITQAFIFAAGRGERMRPLTDSVPKPLVKIKNKAIIDYLIEKLNRVPSIKKIIINGFYLAEQIEGHIKHLDNSKIIFSHEVEKVETGGGLLFARDKIDFNQPLLTMNGDVLWQEKDGVSDIDLMCDMWKSADCDMLLGLKKKEEYFGYDGNGDFNFDAETLAIKRFADSKMSHVFTGLQIINPKILDVIFQKCFSISHFYKVAESSNGILKNVKGVALGGEYFHIGTVGAVGVTESLMDRIS